MKKEFTAEEKREYFKKQRQETEQALIDGVAHCYTEGNFRAYLDVVSRFHNYSLNNCLLIAMQMPEATMVAGFNDWKRKFKRNVCKGEKGIRIMAPMTFKYNVEGVGKDGAVTNEEHQYMRFKMVSVFDYSQTEGQELPQVCKELEGDVENYDMLIQSLINAASVPVTFEEINSGAHGYFSQKENRIVVKTGMAQEQTVKTLIHEIAHSILHCKDAFPDTPKDVKEIQAESVAYMVCRELGIDSSGYSFEYVATWANQDMKTLTEQMEVVRKTADAIITKVRSRKEEPDGSFSFKKTFC